MKKLINTIKAFMAMPARIAELEHELNEVKNALTSDNLYEVVSSLFGEIDYGNLDSRIEDLERLVDGRDCESLDDRIGYLEGYVGGNDVDDMDNRLRDLESEVDDIEHPDLSPLDDFEEKLNDLEERLDRLEENL